MATTWPAVFDRLTSLTVDRGYARSREPFSFDLQPDTRLDAVCRLEAELGETRGYLGGDREEAWTCRVWLAHKAKAAPHVAYRTALVAIDSLTAAVQADETAGDYCVGEDITAQVQLPADDAGFVVAAVEFPVEIERDLGTRSNWDMTKQQYGALTTLTITLASLADAGARESTKVDNTAVNWLDAELQVKVKLAAGTLGSNPRVDVYLYTSADGTTFDGNATGADAAITLGASPNLIPLEPIIPAAVSTAYTRAYRIAEACGGRMPAYWGIVIRNASGVALSGSAGDHLVQYRGIYEGA